MINKIKRVLETQYTTRDGHNFCDFIVSYLDGTKKTFLHVDGDGPCSGLVPILGDDTLDFMFNKAHWHVIEPDDTTRATKIIFYDRTPRYDI